MRKMILAEIEAMKGYFSETGRIPAEPNELEIKKSIVAHFEDELNAMVEDGNISAVGYTINKSRILKINQ